MTQRTARLAAAALFSVALLPAVVVSAQVRAPFHRTTFFFRGGAEVGDSKLSEGWKTTHFLDAGAETDFYLGRISLAVQHLLGRAHEDIPTDARLFYVHIGWGPIIRLPAGAELYLGVNAGQTFMRFPEETISFRRSEGEVAYGLRASLSLPVARGFELDVSGRWFHIFTSDPVDIGIVSAGVRYTFSTPSWLREVLE